MSFERRIVRAFHAAWGSALGDLLWYGLAAGAVWLGFYVLFRGIVSNRKIVPRMPTWGEMGREVACSLRSILIYGLVSGAVVFASASGMRTSLYGKIGRHGWGWYVLSIALAIVLHDAYFYWTHRLMHHPSLFRRLHRTHHLSNNPTPWAAYSFGAGEAVVQAGIGPLLVYALPMHYSAFLVFMTWQIAFNVFGHCGYEIYPHWFLRTWAGRFLNTPTHHAMHHEKVHANFGLYFNVWDRLMGTNHSTYQHRFEQVTARPT
jgi:lathosterol oxidase